MVGIVTVLFVSVIGIPWGIRQLVRYLYVPDAVVLEGSADGRSALARSSELVKGRWFRTAVVFVVVNLVVLLGGTVLGLVLLLVTTGLPLWVFSLLVTTVGALLTPYSAAAVTLLYGDARAAEARSAQEPAEPATV
jgi:hypothetical protein